jgi:O-methyltransferase
MQDFSRIVHICHFVMQTESLEGDIVEFGCYVGDTAKLITKLTKKTVHVYDSFKGLPNDGRNAVVKEKLLENFNRDNIRLPTIHEGWFKDLKPEDIPQKISLAHLDGDLYSSIQESLSLVYGRMVRGGIILVDDYKDPEWPEVTPAVDDFFADKSDDFLWLGGINGKACTKACVRKL